MKYLKDAYYLNSHLKNQKANNEVFEEDFLELSDILLKENKPVYEVGFSFGQRLDYLEEKGCAIVGGIEFDSNFGLYKRHYNLFERSWDIRFTQLEFWSPVNKSLVFTNHFLENVSEEHREEILERFKVFDVVYFNENLELDLPKENNFYVYRKPSDKSGNDLKKSSKGTNKKEPELPNFESLRNRLNAEQRAIEEASKDSTREDVSPSGI